jgi:hypothetical protein
MNILFSTKEERLKYYNNAPDLTEWYEKLSELMDPLVEKISEKKALKNDDAKDVSDIKNDERIANKLSTDGCGKSRNTFVLNVTRMTVKKIAKKYGCRTKDDFREINHETFDAIKKEVYVIVYQKFKEEDEKYGGIWPETTNISAFTPSEFKKAFNSSFSYSTQHINDFVYTDEDRKHSRLKRELRKNLKLVMVDKVKNNSTKITRKDLLKEVNRNLKKIHVKEISMGSLKRFIAESNELTDEKRVFLYDTLDKRKQYLKSQNS